jgi:hypothetical protein
MAIPPTLYVIGVSATYELWHRTCLLKASAFVANPNVIEKIELRSDVVVVPL